MSCKAKKIAKVPKVGEKSEDGANYHGVDLEEEMAKLNKPFEGVSSSKFPSAEEMLNELNEIDKLAEQVEKAQIPRVTVDNWYVPFGKYKKLLGKSVLHIVGQDKKGNEIPEGRRYLAWMLELPYLDTRSKQIISQLLSLK